MSPFIRTTIVSLPLLCIGGIVFAQTTNKVLELEPFHSIYVNSGYSVYLKQTNKQEVKVSALTEIFDITEFKVEDGILHVNIDRKEDNANKSIWEKIDNIKIAPMLKLTISMRDIQELRVNGNGKIIGENSIASTKLDLGVAGSGNIDLDIKGRLINTQVTGSGDISLKGYADSSNVSISGSGSVHAFYCELETALITLSGSGIGEVNVRETLEVKVLGNGIIKHKGNTKNVTKKIYGQGKVERSY